MPPAASSPAHPANALPPGTRLGEFEILEVLGIGGFGIVYRALDHALERHVAIKEYMPAALAGRTETLQVSLRSQSDAETFALGLRSFVNEAKLLARFDHPSLLKVYRFWEQNETAYMAMPVYGGRTLKAARQQMDGSPDEAWLRALLKPLLGAIETLHREGVYHRDIAPDNILIEADGRPVLLDFGAARRVIGDRSQNLTAILKPAYAPIEQYAEASAARQGPWTDLYALGATLHYVLTGQPPAPATARTLHDDLQPLAQRALPGCSPGFLAVVDWMLATRPADRPQSVAALRAALEGETRPPELPVVRPEAHANPAATTVVDVSAPWPATASPAAVQTTLVTPRDPTRPPGRSPGPPAADAGGPPGEGWRGDAGARRTVPLLAGAALVLAVAAGGWWWRSEPAPQPAVAATGPAASVPARAADDVAGGAARPVPAAAPDAKAAVAEPDKGSTRASARNPVREPARDTAPTQVSGKSAARVEPEPTVQPPPARAEPALEAVARPATTPPAASPPAASAANLRPAPAAAAVTPPPVSDEPSELCGKRVLVALVWCMERKCNSREFKDHPACRKWFISNRQRSIP